MSAGIYLLKDDGELIEMNEQAYDSEDLLSDLLAKYPSLLAGNQINSTVPRRWLLISREASLPDKENGSGRWSVDHLFLDQDGIPTLVEVKRSSDTRIRREVVGQMLDYAANAVVYWPVESIRATFEAQCQLHKRDAERLLTDLLESDTGHEEFWQKVKTNLRAGKVRLVFVADQIPTELQRVVEFLNEQMDPAEVLAIEVRKYEGPGLKTLVPRIIGQTAAANGHKNGYSDRKWDEASFFMELESRLGPDEVRVGRKILEWAEGRVTRIGWGRGSKMGSFFPILNHKEKEYQLFTLYTYGTLEILFQYYQNKPPFDSDQKRKELLNRLNKAINGSIPLEAITRRPGVQLSMLKNEATLEQFLDVFAWFIQQIRAS